MVPKYEGTKRQPKVSNIDAWSSGEDIRPPRLAAEPLDVLWLSDMMCFRPCKQMTSENRGVEENRVLVEDQRQFRLPGNSDLGHIKKAHFEDGVLRIMVPKYAGTKRQPKVSNIDAWSSGEDIKAT
ncbi:hypothetical protein CJ030_MR7G029156 [Morella rubra]|uniref:SHSP domain-containing protein n=1 Tax=Morella rubra TaxID=262757 RepID=A0A6A1V875_9ROSI|nr:hypothetical protein CJ030_MR7G029156 [Morella rubra]